jgi:hypothetical protein
MSAQPQPINEQPRQAADLIDRIANALPEELRVDYYRELSHCRNLPENDEMLRILRAMQFLTVLIERAPGQVAVERQQIAQVLASGIESIQATHQATIVYQKQLEARIAKLPAEIAKGINAEAIAAKLSESLRQQFQQTGLPAVAEAIGVQATMLRHTSKDLSAAVDDFAHPRTGVLARVNDAIRWGKSDLENATDHIRVQMNGLGKELYRTIAVLCFGALLIGLVAGVLYQRWLDSPLPHPSAQPSTPAVQSGPPATTPQPNHKKRPQSQVPGQQ